MEPLSISKSKTTEPIRFVDFQQTGNWLLMEDKENVQYIIHLMYGPSGNI